MKKTPLFVTEKDYPEIYKYLVSKGYEFWNDSNYFYWSFKTAIVTSVAWGLALIISHII